LRARLSGAVRPLNIGLRGIVTVIFMNILSWLEKKAFLGEVIHDYGNVSENRIGPMVEKVSILLCQRQGKRQIVLRIAAFGLMSFNVRYAYIPARDVSKLQDVLNDIAARNQE
jgi:hypothetical protein